MKTGVYKIINIVNGKCYIGSCASDRGLKGRLWRHCYKLKRGIHPNPHLQNAWNKYGENNFLFEIIEECLPQQCIEREQHYMDILRPKYNIRLIAESNLGYKHSEEAKRKVSIANKGKVLHTDGNYKFENIKTGEIVICAKFELANKYGLDRSSISKVCNKIENSHHGWVVSGKNKVMRKSKSNISVVRDYLTGERPYPTFGYVPPTINRKFGEEWTDSHNITWRQENGYRTRVNKQADIIRKVMEQKCQNCDRIIKWGTKYDELFFRKTGLCYDCLIEYETKLRILNIYPDYERYKIMSNELGHLKDGVAKLKELIKYFTENEGNVEMLCNSEGFIERWKNTNRTQILKDAKADLKRGRQQITLLSKEKEAAKKRYVTEAKKYQLDVYAR